MDPDLPVLAIFTLTPFLIGGALWLFFVKRKIHRTRGWSKLLAGNLLVLSFLISFLLCGAEYYFRFIFDESDSFATVRTHKKWLERHWKLNDIGFRDTLGVHLRLPPKDVRRVTFIGDSFTAGQRVSDVNDRFGNRYRARHPERETHIFAQCGWDTSHELVLLNNSIRANYKLDLVVLCYCLNDMHDIIPDASMMLGDAITKYKPNYVCEHSYLLNWLNFRMLVSHDAYVKDYFHLLRRHYDLDTWQRQKQRLRAVRDLVASQGGRLVVVTFPFPNMFGDYEFLPVHQMLNTFWSELDVPHLDLLEIYQQQDVRKMMAGSFDGHPSAYAHSLVADAIDGFLADK